MLPTWGVMPSDFHLAVSETVKFSHFVTGLPLLAFATVLMRLLIIINQTQVTYATGMRAPATPVLCVFFSLLGVHG